jgi:myo-inositol-1-phosphate synthase
MEVPPMSAIRLAIAGLGNCASALVQGLYYCRDQGDAAVGVLHPELGGYRPQDIELAAVFDIDRRKVGLDAGQAIWQPPNCTTAFYREVPETGITVAMGPILDGVAAHMQAAAEESRFEPADLPEPSADEVTAQLRSSRSEVLINFLPVGSEQATRFYAGCALEAGCAFVNAMPVFIASDPEWVARFQARGLPLVGDDFKAQLGATITHRALANLFKMRGVPLQRTYQLNIGGNTDFYNMLDHERLGTKRRSKTEAVQSSARTRLETRDIRIGPSDYVPWLQDNKVAFVRMEGALFGGVPMNIELRLSVEDSPNAAAVAIDAIRCARIALDRGIGGVLEGPAAFLCKHPPVQHPDEAALQMLEAFAASPTLAGGLRKAATT